MASKMKYTDIRQMIIRLVKLLCFKRFKKNRDNVKFWALLYLYSSCHMQMT